jgi:hypothetical protein
MRYPGSQHDSVRETHAAAVTAIIVGGFFIVTALVTEHKERESMLAP